MGRFVKFFLISAALILAFAGFAGAEEVIFYHTDQVGTPLAMSDAAGQKVWEADYKPFGEEFAVDASRENDKRFVGNEKDEETGLNYFGARYLSVGVGRFLAPDPVRVVNSRSGDINYSFLYMPQRHNLYGYSLNNPYKYIDPDGRDIAFAVNPLSAGGNGHTSLYFQDARGQWFKYDQGSPGGTSSGKSGSNDNIGFLIGASAPAVVSIQPLFYVGAPPNDSAYIKTTKNQDVAIAKNAVASMKEHNSGNKNYNLYRNNCTDAAVDVVNGSGAGMNIKNPSFTIKPISWFKELKGELKKGSI